MEFPYYKFASGLRPPKYYGFVKDSITTDEMIFYLKPFHLLWRIKTPRIVRLIRWHFIVYFGWSQGGREYWQYIEKIKGKNTQ